MSVLIGSTQPSAGKIKKMRTAVKDLYDLLDKNTQYDQNGLIRRGLAFMENDYRQVKNAIPYPSQEEINIYGANNERDLRISKDKVNQSVFFAASALKESYVPSGMAKDILNLLIKNKPSVYKRK